MTFNKKIILADGREFYGYAFGDTEEKVCEIVFNTSMVGYQEILSDPSYTYQAVVMTYPLIGNYGMADDDYETKTPTIGALIVREYNDYPSNFRSTKTLSEVMCEYKIPGISGIDTRMLARIIRDLGTGKVLITDADTPLDAGLKKLAETEIPCDAVSRVSRKSVEISKGTNAKYHVAAIDCGMKENIVRSLNAHGCDVTIFPWDTAAAEIEKLNPNGVFISNGPGNPEDATPVIELVKALRGKYPIFGICLGHQIIALSYGAKTYKLKFGHRGGNHPVKNLKNGKVEITSQNHSYAVDEKSLSGTPLKVTHINILDSTVEGMECEKDKIFSVQYHPESAPGPEDSTYLFDRFVDLMKEESENA